MLKGYFYRRASEADPSEFEINIRFEVNSKESILAKTSSLNSEGLYFFLPRTKVILVPDERVLLMLELPERGQFKIQTEVNYFCNTTDPDGNLTVCYGIKFMDISHTVWQMIHDFCGIKEDLEDAAFAHIPTSLASIFTPIAPLTPVKPLVESATPSRQPAPPVGDPPKATKETAAPGRSSEQPDIVAKPATVSEVIPAVLTKPAVVSGDFPTYPVISPGTLENTIVTEKHPVVPEDFTAVTAKHSVVPEDFTAVTAKHSVVPEDFTAVTAKHSVIPEDFTAVTAKHSVIPEDFTAVTAKHSVIPEDFTAVTAKHSIVPEDIKVDPEKPVIVPEDIPITPVKPPAEPKESSHTALPSQTAPVQNSIQALAASLASPPIVPSHPKAQSLSQEAIDRLIQKLQAEETAKLEAQAEPPAPPVVPDTSSNPNLDNLWITENELNSIKSNSAPKENPAADPAMLIRHDPFTALKSHGSREEFHYHELNAGPTPAAPPVDVPMPTEREHSAPSSSGKDSSSSVDPAMLKSVIQDNMPANTVPVKKETVPIIPPIMPNNSGAKMDQKSIDRLVQALLQESEAAEEASHKANTSAAPFVAATHEPKKAESKVDPLLQSIATGGIHPSPVKPAADLKPAEPRTASVSPSFGSNYNPVAPGTTATISGSSTTSNIGLNILIPDPSNTRVMDQKSIDKIVHALTQNAPPASGGSNLPSGSSGPAVVPITTATQGKIPVSTDNKRTLDQKAIDQVVQALTQNPSTGSIPASVPQFSSGNEKRSAYSLASLSATLQLDKGELLNGSIEQVYVGGLMVRIEKELPLNCSLKITILGEAIRIIDIHGACTNCEPAGFGKSGYLAEIFFKNLSNAHMEQFRSLISKLDID
jgi:hypothetical protein